MSKQWTRDQIDALLRANPKAVERAMIRLYELQTGDERAAGETKHNNNVGFAGNAAKRGSYYARWVMSGRQLSGHHLDRALSIALRHSRQLVAIANGR